MTKPDLNMRNYIYAQNSNSNFCCQVRQAACSQIKKKFKLKETTTTCAKPVFALINQAWFCHSILFYWFFWLYCQNVICSSAMFLYQTWMHQKKVNSFCSIRFESSSFWFKITLQNVINLVGRKKQWKQNNSVYLNKKNEENRSLVAFMTPRIYHTINLKT